MAAYLIDTHALLWFLDDSPKLSKSARATMEDEQVELMVSVVSLWEIAIKANLGKLEIEGDISQLRQDLSTLGIRLQSILVADLDGYLRLPIHHRDPFDRLLIAQALVMDIPLISADAHFDAYEVQRLW